MGSFYARAGLSRLNLGGVIFITSTETLQECATGMVFGEYSANGRGCEHGPPVVAHVLTRGPFVCHEHRSRSHLFARAPLHPFSGPTQIGEKLTTHRSS